ncbi:MAG: hypothetical protein LBC18_07585 [Opitutaceae bacterium]|nr:hypothetical protein [Opitutaceae bacterium]
MPLFSVNTEGMFVADVPVFPIWIEDLSALFAPRVKLIYAPFTTSSALSRKMRFPCTVTELSASVSLVCDPDASPIVIRPLLCDWVMAALFCRVMFPPPAIFMDERLELLLLLCNAMPPTPPSNTSVCPALEKTFRQV